MKSIFYNKIYFFLACLLVLLSCQKSALKKSDSKKTSALDTSTTLIANQKLVGDWIVVTDSVNYENIDTVYHGTSQDRYIFTKYGNMYVKSGFNRLIDTAIYTISPDDRLDWTNLYESVLGAVISGTSYSGYYAIISASEHNLILSQSIISTLAGERKELITLKK